MFNYQDLSDTVRELCADFVRIELLYRIIIS